MVIHGAKVYGGESLKKVCCSWDISILHICNVWAIPTYRLYWLCDRIWLLSVQHPLNQRRWEECGQWHILSQPPLRWICPTLSHHKSRRNTALKGRSWLYVCNSCCHVYSIIVVWAKIVFIGMSRLYHHAHQQGGVRFWSKSYITCLDWRRFLLCLWV